MARKRIPATLRPTPANAKRFADYAEQREPRLGRMPVEKLATMAMQVLQENLPGTPTEALPLVSKDLPDPSKVWDADGTRYFSREAVERELNDCDLMSRSTVVLMSPADFLALAKPGYAESKQLAVDQLVREGTPLADVPKLFTQDNRDGTARVDGHEGRHRARALQARGVRQMPVVVRSYTVRWGQTARLPDPFPAVLISEDGKKRLPTPPSALWPSPWVEAQGEEDDPSMTERLPVGGSGPTVTPAGFPWPSETLLYHTTVAYSTILREGFKTRDQLRAETGIRVEATGGGTDKAVSFAVDKRVNYAIELGLRFLIRAARGEVYLGDLWEQAAEECPAGARNARAALAREGWTDEDTAMFDQGLRRRRMRGIMPLRFADLPPGSKMVQSWADRMQNVPPEKLAEFKQLAAEWWEPIDAREPENDWTREGDDWRREVLAAHYKSLLAHGSSAQECYDPLFFGTNMDYLATLSPEDVGTVAVRLPAARIALEATEARKFGYLTRAEATYSRSFLEEWATSVKMLFEYGSPFREGYYRNPSMVGPFPFRKDEEGEYTPQNILLGMSSMSEVRSYAPDTARIDVGASEAAALPSWLVGRFFHPYFEEFEGMERPGDVVRRRLGAGEVERLGTLDPRVEKLPSGGGIQVTQTPIAKGVEEVAVQSEAGGVCALWVGTGKDLSAALKGTSYAKYPESLKRIGKVGSQAVYLMWIEGKGQGDGTALLRYALGLYPDYPWFLHTSTAQQGRLTRWYQREGFAESTEDADRPRRLMVRTPGTLPTKDPRVEKLRAYHGSERSDLTEFRDDGVKRHTFGPGEQDVGIFVSLDPDFANAYAQGPEGTVYAVEVPDTLRLFAAEGLLAREAEYFPFEYDALNTVGRALYDDLDDGKIPGFDGSSETLKSILLHDYSTIEHSSFTRWLREHGYDGAWVREYRERPNNLLVFDRSKVRILDKAPRWYYPDRGPFPGLPTRD